MVTRRKKIHINKQIDNYNADHHLLIDISFLKNPNSFKMVSAVCDRVIVVQEPIIRVTSGQTITSEAKGTDTSLRINFLVSNNNYAMMYYFLRFFKMRTAHRVVGKVLRTCFDNY